MHINRRLSTDNDYKTPCAWRNLVIFFQSSFGFSGNCAFLNGELLNVLLRSQASPDKYSCTYGDDFSVPFAFLELSFFLRLLGTLSS